MKNICIKSPNDLFIWSLKWLEENQEQPNKLVKEVKDLTIFLKNYRIINFANYFANTIDMLIKTKSIKNYNDIVSFVEEARKDFLIKFDENGKRRRC